MELSTFLSTYTDRLNPQERAITTKVLQGKRISDDDAYFLFTEPELSFVGMLAHHVKQQKQGDAVFFNRNFHVEPTNVCIYDCKFCSYSRKIRKREDGWEMSMEEILEQVRAFDHKPVTEVHIVGGVLPQYDLPFYEELFAKIKAHRPELHIKALTSVEYHYIFKKSKVSYREGLQRLIDAGLNSIPGGGAEIFAEDIRAEIAADKVSSEGWLDLHRTAHQLGLRSNATMLYGHIEGPEHRVDHMRRLRDLQDETGGFQTFIPLKFRKENNEMSHLGETTVIDDLRTYAVGRIYLDNFDHVKAYWPMIGRHTAQLSLSYGVDDIDGTIDDTTKIYSMAGAEDTNPAMSTPQLIDLVRRASMRPIERDTLYNVLHDYSVEEFGELMGS